MASQTRRGLKEALWWGLGLALGILAAIVPPLLVAIPWTPSLRWMWVSGLFLSAVALGVARPSRAWRWGLAVGLGPFLVVTLEIVIDIARDPTSHATLLLELFVALVAAVPCALAGAYLGAALGRLARSAGRGSVPPAVPEPAAPPRVVEEP